MLTIGRTDIHSVRKQVGRTGTNKQSNV